MEEETTITNIKKDTFGFFKYVFNFNEENSCAILNVLQYSLMSIIPIIIILRIMKNYTPEEDETKGSLEILTESTAQILFIVLSIWFINRIIHYFPTYSGCPYEEFMPTSAIIPLLIILFTIQSKLGMKINILVDRVIDLWYGNTNNTTTNTTQEKNGNNVRVTQPISGSVATHQPSQADTRDQLLPSNLNLTQMPQIYSTNIAKPPNNTDLNQLHLSQVTPIQPQNGMNMNMNMNEPMAANDAFGSSFGTSFN